MTLDRMTRSATIYVYLLGEGVDVWRPVSTGWVRDDIYCITGARIDDTETWEFANGDVVRCRAQVLASDGRTDSCLVGYGRVTLTTQAG